MSFTIQTITGFGVQEERTVGTANGARTSLRSAIGRVSEGSFDDEDLSRARKTVAAWDGKSPLRLAIGGFQQQGFDTVVWVTPNRPGAQMTVKAATDSGDYAQNTFFRRAAGASEARRLLWEALTSITGADSVSMQLAQWDALRWDGESPLRIFVNGASGWGRVITAEATGREQP